MEDRETHGRPRLPEVTVGVDDPHSKALDPLLLSSNPFVAAKHAQGELIDAGLQQRAQLLLEVGGLVLKDLVHATTFALAVDVQQAVGVGRVVIVVGLDQGEERPGHVGPLFCLWRRGGWRGGPLGTAPPPGEAEAAPAAVPGDLRFVGRTFPDDLLLLCGGPGRAGHVWTLR